MVYLTFIDFLRLNAIQGTINILDNYGLQILILAVERRAAACRMLSLDLEDLRAYEAIADRTDLESDSSKLDDIAYCEIVALPRVELLKRLPCPENWRLNYVFIDYAVVVEPMVIVFAVDAGH
jgi:hypothetical protein